MRRRRTFIRTALAAGIGLTLSQAAGSFPVSFRPGRRERKRIGLIGLDTSHSTAFTQAFNKPTAAETLGGYRVVAAYPYGSREIKSSFERIPAYTEEVKKLGVEITSSLDELLDKVDVVLLETNDGRLHLEQAARVIEAGKPVFIDKPMAASLSDGMAIFELARKNQVPVFSSSSLRYIRHAQEIRAGQLGPVLGADTYSPAVLEKTHPDLFWYGIHGVETLFTVMGTGCETVSRVHTANTDTVVGIWDDGRTGTFRGTRSGKHAYGGTAFCERGNQVLGPYEGYEPLLHQIVRFFETGTSPVEEKETLEILAFMEAADASKRRKGKAIRMQDVLAQAQRSVSAKIKTFGN